ncbi:hypothetical protein DY000_02059990 [Brassica cretica]|uniref:Uncharacterized protein n=1 Tax=Brassica cretica TaxID=69181 RepID=A0ABQ7API8_BRACR|nr:hypothetical protein DY000_02059990 [Brassica cretica]
MSSSQNDKKSSDAEMVEASSQAPESTPSDNAPASVAGFLSFRDKMARPKAEKEPIHVCAKPPSSPAPVVTAAVDPVVQAPQDAGEQSGTGILCVLDASAQPYDSSTTPIVVDDKEKVTESMLPPPIGVACSQCYSGCSSDNLEEEVYDGQQWGAFASGRVEPGVATSWKCSFFPLAFYS